MKENNWLFIDRIQNIDIIDPIVENFPQIFDLLDGTACFFCIYFPEIFFNTGL